VKKSPHTGESACATFLTSLFAWVGQTLSSASSNEGDFFTASHEAVAQVCLDRKTFTVNAASGAPNKRKINTIKVNLLRGI